MRQQIAIVQWETPTEALTLKVRRRAGEPAPDFLRRIAERLLELAAALEGDEE